MIHKETQRVEIMADNIAKLLEEMKQEISGVKKMKQSVRNRKNKNIDITRAVFATLRKAIDEQEEQIITDIKIEGNKMEKNLEVSLSLYNKMSAEAKRISAIS